MNTIKNLTRDEANIASLAFHIRRRRRFHGAEALSQSELARVAGICPRVLRSYERSKNLPRSVRNILAISLALEIPVEAVLAPQVQDELRRAIDKRRRTGKRRP